MKYGSIWMMCGLHFELIFGLVVRYKPVELKYIFSPIREEFDLLFPLTFTKAPNSKFLANLMTCFANRRWKDLLLLMTHVHKAALSRLQSSIPHKQLLHRLERYLKNRIVNIR